MTVTPSSIRQNFPAFSDSVKYTDAQMQFWITISSSFIDPCTWLDENLRDLGTQFFVLHYITIAAEDNKTSAAGGNPGQIKGPYTNKTVDKVSVGYAAALVALEGGGQWNLTKYGVQFLQIARMVGMGGIQMLPAAPYPNLNIIFNPYI